VQRYAPEIQRRLRPRLRPTNDSWPVDEVRDDLLDHLGVEPDRLREVAKREVAFPWTGEKPSAGLN